MFLTRVLTAIVLLLLAGSLKAQSTMTIDGSCNFQLAATGNSVSINPSNGNVTVTSASGANCTAAAVSLTLPASAPVGTNFNVSWNATGTSGANPCTPSGGGSSNWSSQGALPATGNRTITAPGGAANNVSFTISCATGGTPVTDTKTMNFTAGAASVNLVAPTSVAVSANFVVSWTSSGTSGTNPCTPSGGGTSNWASQGALEPNGQRTITAPASAGSAVFSISCATGATPVTDSETISFTGGGGANCTGAVPPPGIGAGGATNWGTIYAGAVFPEPYNTNNTILVTRGQTRVIRIDPNFASPDTSRIGALVYVPSGVGAVVATISPCPNDFRQSELNTPTNRCYRGPANQIDFPFSFNNSGAGFCNLQAGQTYYINLHVGSGATPDSTGAFCESATCGYLGGTQAGFTASSPEEQ